MLVHRCYPPQYVAGIHFIHLDGERLMWDKVCCRCQELGLEPSTFRSGVPRPLRARMKSRRAKLIKFVHPRHRKDFVSRSPFHPSQHELFGSGVPFMIEGRKTSEFTTQTLFLLQRHDGVMPWFNVSRSSHFNVLRG